MEMNDPTISVNSLVAYLLWQQILHKKPTQKF